MVAHTELAQVLADLREGATQGLFLFDGKAHGAEAAVIGAISPFQAEVVAARQRGSALEHLHDAQGRHKARLLPCGLLFLSTEGKDKR